MDIAVGQLTIRFRVTGEESNGTVAIFEMEVPPGAKVPAPHFHDAYEETLFGLEGTLDWTVEGTTHTLGAGDVLCIRRGEVHGFVNDGPETARQLAVVSPAVIGPRFFQDMGEAVPDPERIREVMLRHGLTPASAP